MDPQLRKLREQFQEEAKETGEKKKASNASAAPRRYVAIQFKSRKAFLTTGWCKRLKSYDVDIHIVLLNILKMQCIRLRATSHHERCKCPFYAIFPVRSACMIRKSAPRLVLCATAFIAAIWVDINKRFRFNLFFLL